MAPHRDLRFLAEEGLFEFQRKILTKVSAPLNPAATATTASAEQVTESEKLSENVAKILKDRGIKACSLSRASKSGVAVAIVYGPLFGIGEHGIGLADFFEFFLSVGVVRIAVRMELEREFAIGALQFLFRDRLGHAENFIVITFCVSRQNESLSLKSKSEQIAAGNACHPRPHETRFPAPIEMTNTIF
jgi:hypothetical protein